MGGVEHLCPDVRLSLESPLTNYCSHISRNLALCNCKETQIGLMEDDLSRRLSAIYLLI